MTETLAHGYSPESSQRQLSNKYQQGKVYMFYKKYLPSCVSDESILSIESVKLWWVGKDQLTLWLAGSSHYRGVVPGLEIIFFPGSPILHLQKLPKGVYRDEFIFGLRAEIRGGRRRIQGSPGHLTHPYFEPWVRFPRFPAKCHPPTPPPPPHSVVM